MLLLDWSVSRDGDRAVDHLLVARACHRGQLAKIRSQVELFGPGGGAKLAEDPFAEVVQVVLVRQIRGRRVRCRVHLVGQWRDVDHWHCIGGHRRLVSWLACQT